MQIEAYANLAGVTPVMGAAYSGNAGAKTEPLDRVKKNAATYAASSGCVECLRELIRVGTPVNAALENQLTRLMWAAAYGHEPAVRMLLVQGADRRAKDNRAKLPLTWRSRAITSKLRAYSTKLSAQSRRPSASPSIVNSQWLTAFIARAIKPLPT
jgi:hypothetical protein